MQEKRCDTVNSFLKCWLQRQKNYTHVSTVASLLVKRINLIYLQKIIPKDSYQILFFHKR